MKSSSLSLVTLLAACGSARIRQEVPVTLSEIVEPELSVVPDASTATVVIVYAGFPDPEQAITMVSRTGRFLGQLRPHSYAVATVPAGPVGFYGGRPELGFPEWCGGLHGDVAAGQVYVLRVGGSLGIVVMSATDSKQAPAETVANELSYYVRLDGPNSVGQRSTDQVMTDYWTPCFEAAEKKVEDLRATELGQMDTARGFVIQNAYGYPSLIIPEPL